MATAYDDGETTWAMAIRQRRRALLQRLFLGTTAAVVFSPVMGWPLSLGWAVCYFLIQLLDLAVFAPITGNRVDRMGPVRTAFGCVMLFGNALSFGSLSVPLWILGGPMGAICSALLLSSGTIYAVVNSPRSKLVLVCTLSAQFLYLSMIPVMMGVMWQAEPGFIAATAISIVVFGAYCINTWSRMNRARDAEIVALVEADKKRQVAERLLAGRSAFLAAVGHDLRTPISAILTGAAELEREARDANTRSNAALIADAGQMMKVMLDDLLDHAKLEAGRMTITEEDFNLRDLLAHTVRLWQRAAVDKGLKLRVEGARTVPAFVRGDPVRIRQILNNLISNALKFTSQGSICLSVQAWAEDPRGYAVLIAVRDTGAGMTAEQMQRLFTPFDQTDDGVSARFGGTGLGLTISRDLAELMGGRLTAHSVEGQGATFTLAITLRESEREAAPRPVAEVGRGEIVRDLKPKAAATTPSRSKTPLASVPLAAAPAALKEASDDSATLRVLVVDDHDINRRAVQLILSSVDCEITMAADGLAALAACDQSMFDVIFMDVRMPELDGRETTRRLRAGSGPNRRTPVIAVTADTAPEDIAACMAAGMTYFVSKPLTPGMLLDALSHVLSGPADDDGLSAVA